MKSTFKPWITTTIYIDVDTGEQITKENAKENYEIIKKEKNVTITNKNRIIEFAVDCRKSKYKQGKLEL